MTLAIVACESSARVRDALRAIGVDAWSCDLEPCEGDPRYHIQGDAIEAMRSRPWDLMIAHPPCTYLTVSGNKWMKPEYRDRFPNRPQQREEAVAFFLALWNADIPRIAIENPIGILSSRFRKPDQVLQPFMFGHPERKATCLWLKNLPKLTPTNLVPLPDDPAKAQRLHWLPPGPDRARERSRTFPGIARAIASQWGTLPPLTQ